jgi:uncharacterized protein YidB (DUF937 family)
MERCHTMSVNAIGGGQALSTGSAAQVQQVHHHHGHGGGARKAGMDAAAQALGMSSSDLQTALKGGQSLSSLAQSKGVNADSLTKTISDAIAKANPSVSGDRAQQIAQRLVNGPSDSAR